MFTSFRDVSLFIVILLSCALSGFGTRPALADPSPSPPYPGCERIDYGSYLHLNEHAFPGSDYGETSVSSGNLYYWRCPESAAVYAWHNGAGFYAGVTGGGAAVCTNEIFYNIVTAGAPDMVNTAARQACGTQGFFGGTIGTTVYQGQTGSLGASGTFLFGTGPGATLTGIPDVTVGPLSATDKTIDRDRSVFMFTLDGTLPINPYVSVTASVGVAAVDKKVTSDCNGTCIAAGATPFTQSQTLWLPGLVFGPKVNFQLPGTPITLTAAVSEIVTGGKTVDFGQPGTVFTTSKISQYDTIASITASVPLGRYTAAQADADVHRFLSGQ